MGVNIFILDRRLTRLAVGGTVQNVGSLRGFWKITEMDQARSREMRAAEKVSGAIPSPVAAMVAGVSEMPLGTKDGIPVKAHLVIGWDEGRTSVTDMGWDYLPVLGYAVRDPDSGVFVLHEERDRALHRLDQARAVELGLVGADGLVIRHGQPVITECRSVRLYITGYAEADCTFDNGRQEKLLISVPEGKLPEPAWLAGKKPMEVKQFPPPPLVPRPATGTGGVRR